jgi:hypothetical protein
MANKQGYAEVEFDGETKLLRFNFNAMADVEEYFGIGIGVIMSEERIGFSTIRALYWAGLKWKMKGLTIERVGDMLTDKMDNENISFMELMDPITKAIKAAGWIKDQPQKTNKEDETKN